MPLRRHLGLSLPDVRAWQLNACDLMVTIDSGVWKQDLVVCVSTPQLDIPENRSHTIASVTPRAISVVVETRSLATRRQLSVMRFDRRKRFRFTLPGACLPPLRCAALSHEA